PIARRSGKPVHAVSDALPRGAPIRQGFDPPSQRLKKPVHVTGHDDVGKQVVAFPGEVAHRINDDLRQGTAFQILSGWLSVEPTLDVDESLFPKMAFPLLVCHATRRGLL